MVTVDDRLDKIEKKITDNLISEKEWEPPKRCIFCRGYDFQKKVFTNMVLCSSPNAYEEGDRKVYYGHIPEIISGELVRQYCRVNGITGCDHNIDWLVEDASEIIEKIADLLECKSEKKYNPFMLFEVLYEYVEKQNAPRILMNILNTVGKEWLHSLDPNDFDIGYTEIVNQGLERSVMEFPYCPPLHPNIYRTAKEWAENCDCDECQSYWQDRKEELEKAIKELN